MIRLVAAIIPTVLLTGCLSQQPAPTVDRVGTTATRASTAVQPVGPGYYTVKRGDTLYRIALDNGQDHRDIAAWNNIANPSAIKEGQVLRVIPPGAAEPVDGAVSKPVATASGVETRSLDQQAQPVAASSGALKREPRVGKEPYSEEAYARLNKQAEVAKPLEVKPEVKPESSPPSLVQPSGPDDVGWAWPSTAKVSAPYNDSSNKGLDFSGKAGDPVLAAGDGKVVYAGTGLRGFGELVIVKHNATFLSAYAHNRKILVKEGQSVTRGQRIAEMGNTDSESVKLHFEIRKQGKPVDPAAYLPKR
jgi:lipoprotein NlpD